LDGYYCIITNETGMAASDIIEAYRGLWRIEETFKVTKSTLKTRPVYVSRRECIHAHFLICYVALIFIRLIQSDLCWRYSAQAIQEALASMSGTLMQKNYYLFSYRTLLTDELGKLYDIDFARKVLSTGQIKKIFADSKKV
jgi:transposase